MTKFTTLPDTASVQDMQRNYRKLLDRVKQTRAPMFILRNNVPEAVIVDVESWNLLNDETYNAKSEAAAMEAIAEYKRDKKAGKMKLLKSKLSDLMK